MSDLRLFTSPYGIEPISKKQADEFYETYHKIFDPIRRKYLNIYNKNIRAIKQAINIGISKQKIKAILIETPFSEIA